MYGSVAHNIKIYRLQHLHLYGSVAHNIKIYRLHHLHLDGSVAHNIMFVCCQIQEILWPFCRTVLWDKVWLQISL